MLDVLLVVVVHLLLLLVLWPMVHAYGPRGFVLQSAVALTLLLRRTAPLSVLLVMLLSTIGLHMAGRVAPDLLAATLDPTRVWAMLATPFAVYSAMVYGADRRRALVMTGVIAVVAARPLAPTLEVAIGTGVIVVLPALLGTYVAALNERVERAEREQHRVAERARVEERVRLAAEMHDVVTHRVSLMVLQAGALGVTATDPGTRAAAEDLRAAGCQALEELRDLVGVLRTAPDAVAEDDVVPRAGGQAAAPDFADLVAESDSVGVRVWLTQTGGPDLASPVVARTAYRIVQEALTNVRKHAPGAEAEVTLEYRADRVRVTVRNTAPARGADAALAGAGSGTGLLGLRQRVDLVSGTFLAGPTADGGFEVETVLPAYVPTRDRPVGALGGTTSRKEPAR